MLSSPSDSMNVCPFNGPDTATSLGFILPCLAERVLKYSAPREYKLKRQRPTTLLYTPHTPEWTRHVLTDKCITLSEPLAFSSGRIGSPSQRVVDAVQGSTGQRNDISTRIKLLGETARHDSVRLLSLAAHVPCRESTCRPGRGAGRRDVAAGGSPFRGEGDSAGLGRPTP